MFDNKFNVKKALQALYYLQTYSDNVESGDILYLLKMIYFADRYHIRHYGILATNDIYIAMKLGPVASNIKDLLKGRIKNDAIEEISEYSVKIKPQGTDELSESFIESLDFAIATYGKFGAYELSDISHDYPEWSKFKDALESKKIKGGKINLIDFFENPNIEESCCLEKIFTNDPYNMPKEELEFNKSQFLMFM